MDDLNVGHYCKKNSASTEKTSAEYPTIYYTPSHNKVVGGKG